MAMVCYLCTHQATLYMKFFVCFVCMTLACVKENNNDVDDMCVVCEERRREEEVEDGNERRIFCSAAVLMASLSLCVGRIVSYDV